MKSWVGMLVAVLATLGIRAGVAAGGEPPAPLTASEDAGAVSQDTGCVGMQHVAKKCTSSRIIGHNFAKSSREQAFIQVLDGRMHFIFGGRNPPPIIFQVIHLENLFVPATVLCRAIVNMV